MGRGMMQHRGDQRVADAQPLSGAVADRQAQPGYLASGRAGRHARWTQLREEARENVGLLRREQTQRAELVTGLIERDPVGRVIAVRSEERRVEKEGVRTCRSRWSVNHEIKKQRILNERTFNKKTIK